MSRPEVDLAPPTRGDITELADNLRAQDRAELDACGHPDHLEAIASSVARSVWCYAVRVDGELAAIMGVSAHGTLMAPIGVPWMLGTDLVPRNRRTLAKLAPEYIARMLREFPVLMNLVHARNTVAVQWLRRCGFSLQDPHPVGPHGEPFHLFEMRRDV